MIPLFRKNGFSSNKNRTSRQSFASRYAFFFYFTLIVHSNCHITVKPVISPSSEEIGNEPLLLSVETKQYYDVKWKIYQSDVSEDLREKFVSSTESGQRYFKVIKSLSKDDEHLSRQKRKANSSATTTSQGRL